MKKLIAILGLAVAFSTTESFAQTATQAANVILTVQSPMILTNVASTPLTFGTRLQGATSVTVDAITGGASCAPFTLTGAIGSHAVTVSWTSTPLSKTGAADITWTPIVAVNNVNNQTAGGGAAEISNNGSVTTDGSGSAWLWVGGTISSIPTGQVVGTYNATVTLTITE